MLLKSLMMRQRILGMVMSEAKVQTIGLQQDEISKNIRFLAKTLTVNEKTMKSFSKISCSKSILNCRLCHSYIKLKHLQHREDLVLKQRSVKNKKSQK